MPLPLPAARSVLLVAWVGYFTTLQFSVVRYRLGIVVVLALATGLLGAVQLRRLPLPVPSRLPLAAAMGACAVVAEVLPFFSYASPTEQRWLAHAAALTCLIVAVLLAARRPRGATVAAVTGAVATSSAVIVLDPAPRIDVWVILQQAADGMASGQNIYEMVWRGSPGIKDAFTYLPWTAVLLAPGRWLAGDVRWALLTWSVAGLLLLVALGVASSPSYAGARRPASRAGIGAGAGAILLATAPGSLTQAEQAWTEPLLFALLAGWAVLVRRGHPGWAVIPLALGCASKQHLALLLPVLACWGAFGLRRTSMTVGMTAALLLPWFAASPSAFVHDTVTLLVGFHPIRFADTVYIAALNELGRTPPFWLTGAVVLGTLALACSRVRRDDPDLAEVLRWLALVLLVANLVNKQAFYNQYWLVGALVAMSLAATPLTRPADPAVAAPGRPIASSR